MCDAKRNNENTPDIYISLRQKDDAWGKVINMGDGVSTQAYALRSKERN